MPSTKTPPHGRFCRSWQLWTVLHGAPIAQAWTGHSQPFWGRSLLANVVSGLVWRGGGAVSSSGLRRGMWLLGYIGAGCTVRAAAQHPPFVGRGLSGEDLFSGTPSPRRSLGTRREAKRRQRGIICRNVVSIHLRSAVLLRSRRFLLHIHVECDRFKMTSATVSV